MLHARRQRPLRDDRDVRGLLRCKAYGRGRALYCASSVTTAVCDVPHQQRRREMLAAAMVLLAPSWQPSVALADEQPADFPAVPVTSPSAAGPRVYLDVRIDGKPAGRIVVELMPDVAPVGAARFADLAEGKEGVGFRLSKWDGIFPTYIRNEGVKTLSYTADGESSISGGASTQYLEEELARSGRPLHTQSGLVSLQVLETTERAIKERLVARDGQLVTVQEQAGEAPNGTGFTITTAASPELDAAYLVVGRVVQGMDVVSAIAAQPFSKPRDDWFDRPFFEAGKAIGDKRADVAEKFFRRPLKRVFVAGSGILV